MSHKVAQVTMTIVKASFHSHTNIHDGASTRKKFFVVVLQETEKSYTLATHFSFEDQRLKYTINITFKYYFKLS